MMPGCRPRGSSSVGRAAVVCLLLLADPAGAATHEVLIRNFAFEPSELTVEAGDHVRWTVVSGRHSVTAKDRAFDSDELETGLAFERRFEESGVFPYFCTPHDFMRATVTVLPGPSYRPVTLAALAAALLLGVALTFARRRRAG
jgi:plastocyanin